MRHARPSVQEVPFAGEHHREAELVGALDDRRRRCIAPPGWMTTATPGRGRGLDAVGERIERVARARAAARRGRRPSSPRSRPTRPGSAGRRRCRRPGRPSRARSRSTSRARRSATRARASRHCSAVGATLVTTRQSLAAGREVVRRPARGTRRRSGGSRASAAPGAGASSSRVFLRFACSASIAPRLVARARSRRRPAGPRPSRSTVASSIGRFSATMPPNADRSSHSSARWYAVARSSATATPHGFACLMIAHGGPVAEVVHELPRGVGVVVVEVREREPAVLRARRPTSSSCRAAGSARRAGAGSRRSAASRRCARARARGAAAAASSPSASHSTIAASYAAVRANASSASARRVSSPTRAVVARSSSSTASYWSGLGDDRDPRVVLRRGAHHRRPADVDHLDARVARRTGRGSTRRGRTARCRAPRGRRGATPCRGRRGCPPWIFGCSVTTRWSSISGDAGDLLDRRHRDAGLGERPARCRPTTPARRRARASPRGEVDQAGLVVDRQQRARSALIVLSLVVDQLLAAPSG